MPRHIYTINKIVESLDFLIGSRVFDCFSQESEVLMLGFYDGESEHFLEFIADAKNDSLFLRHKFAKAKSNVRPLFSSLYGETLQNIKVLSNDRIILLEFVKVAIYITLFGGSKSNIYLCQKDRTVLDAFFADNDIIGAKLDFPQMNLFPLAEFDSETMLLDALSRSDLQFGKFYSRQFLLQYNFENKNLASLNENERVAIYQKAKDFKLQILNSQAYYILEDENKKLQLSFLPFENYQIKREFADINEAVYRLVVENIKSDLFKELYKPLKSTIEKIYKSTKATLSKVEDTKQFEDRANEYRTFAEILMSQGNPKIKAGKQLKTHNWEGEEITIELDEKLNLIDNGQKYFKKAKNTLEELKQLNKRLPEIKSKYELAKNALEEINSSNQAYQLEEIEKKYQKLLGKKMESKEQKKEQFRKFELGENYILYVGKNAANNDELTMRFAKSNDIWFHARGVGGSHCVLKVHNKDKVPKNIIEKAAQISAYYSQARNGKYVPVAYTFKKYVTKPKGSAPGQVALQREEVIMVEPKLEIAGND